jgi:DNA-binding SARP family transcriptional activator
MSAGGGGEPGRLVRAHRAAAGLTQQRLASLAGVSLRTVRDIEQGRVLRPHPRSLRRLRDALALTPAEWGELAAAVDAAAAPAGSSRMWVGVLGPLVLRHRGVDVQVPSAKLRRLLGLLALHAPHPVSTEEIVSVLWDTEPPPTRIDLVKGYATRLRALLEPDRGTAPVLVRRGAGYALVCTARQCDVRLFEDLAGQAERAGAHADPGTVLRLWEEALRCWRGPLLPDLDPVVREHPAALAVRRRRRDGVLAYADLRAAAGEHRLAVDALHELAAAEPLHEGLHARLMRALAGSGQQAAAFATYT